MMWEVLNQYWVQILLSVISIIIGWAVGYAFYRLQKRDAASAKTERLKQAQKELVDIIESQIISKQNVTDESVRHLIAASEREYLVNLKSICTPISLFQDVALRLQKSKHLDIEQKGEYADQIEKTISTILEERIEVPEGIQEPWELVNVLENAIEADDKQKSQETISALKERLAETPALTSSEIQVSTKRWQLLASLYAGVATGVVTNVVLTSIWKEVDVKILTASVTITLSVLLAFTYWEYRREREHD